MSNNISFLGRIGSDPELRQVGENTVLDFSLVHDVGFGQNKKPFWIRTSLWNKRATALQPYLKKGDQIYVTGELSQREYTNKEGQEKTSIELKIVDLELVSNKGGENSPAPQSPAATAETESDAPF